MSRVVLGGACLVLAGGVVVLVVVLLVISARQATIPAQVWTNLSVTGPAPE